MLALAQNTHFRETFMKKLFSLMLVALMAFAPCFALVSCDKDEDTDNSNTGSDVISKEQWEQAIAPESFDNVTFTMQGDFVSGYEYGEPFSYSYKLAGNKAVETTEGFVLDAVEVQALKSVYINTAAAVLENFDNFEYDEVNKVFKSKNDITYSVNVMGQNATIIAKNVEVTFDTDKNIAEIETEMIQQFVESGKSNEYVLNVKFEYSDYGTTVVD